MLLAPVIERELRVASRQPSTYWLRWLAAGLFTGIGWMQLLAIELTGAQANSGLGLLGTAAWLAFAACAVAGPLLASDTLSREKRQGTLGLLFLTDLSPQAVLWGKLGALAVRACTMALAGVPILAVAIPLGGVTPERVAALAAVLLHTLFWSLAIAVLFSACCIDARSSMALSGFVVGVIVLGGLGLPNPLGPAPVGLAGGGLAAGPTRLPIPPTLPDPRVLLSPTALLRLVLSPNFTLAGALGQPAVFLALGAQLLTTLLALSLAGLVLSRSWRETNPAAALVPASPGAPALLARLTRGQGRKLRPWLERSPWSWLAQRRIWHRRFVQGLFIAMPWVALGLGARRDPDIWLILLWILQFLLKVLVASEAAHLFVEHRRQGLFELLLTTPVSGREIAKAHAGAMRRLVVLPALSLAAAPWLWGAIPNSRGAVAYLALAAIMLLDIEALIWVAPSRALRLKRPHLAGLSALVRVLVLPGMFAGLFTLPLAAAGLLGLVMLYLLWVWFLGLTILTARENIERLREAADEGRLEPME